MTILFYPGTPTEFRTAYSGYLKKFFKFDLVVVPSDMHRIEEMELLRWAKKNKIKTIAIQPSLYDRAKNVEKFVDWENSQRMPMFLVKIRKYLGHFWYYILKPLLQFQKPFLGKSSYILHTGQSGMRDADEQWVWDKWQYDILLKDGVSKEKLKIITPPLMELDHKKKNKKTIIILVPSDQKVDKKHEEIWDKVINDLRIIKELEIIVKPHSNTKKISKYWNPIQYKFIDEILDMADMVINLPPANSTFTYLANLNGKIAIAFDPFHEWRGDFLKGQLNIKYIDNYADLLQFAEKYK